MLIIILEIHKYLFEIIMKLGSKYDLLDTYLSPPRPPPHAQTELQTDLLDKNIFQHQTYLYTS